MSWAVVFTTTHADLAKGVGSFNLPTVMLLVVRGSVPAVEWPNYHHIACAGCSPQCGVDVLEFHLPSSCDSLR